LGGLLYVIFPVAMTTYGGMGLNYLKSLGAPAGTLNTEANRHRYRDVAAAN
jgi:hypothetical protein